ncbi:MAG: gluconeogenesis factor YvcK family protein [Candidatus Spechtbacterales bacterium]|nr:gluconeogenesis factor YvcK family protein [Candidatus Spechtbacterales bacterium]
MKNEDKKKNVVVIGGGTGASILLRGLKEYPVKLSAVITTADTGGSSGRLRKEIGMAPPGDVRQCFVALNQGNHPLLEHFNIRFSGGSLKGHTFGNIFLALLWQNYGDFQKAVEEAEKMFASEHSIIPVTTGPTNLVAYLNDGQIVEGEASIIQVDGLNNRLSNLSLIPRELGNPKAKRAIKNADYIIIGPGNLFASLTPPLLVDGIKEAILESGAEKIYVLNLLNQKKLTRGFFARDYLNHFERIMGKDIFDKVIYNTKKIRAHWLKKYNIEDRPIEVVDIGDRFIGANLVDTNIKKQDPSDPMIRTIIRHDYKKLGEVLWKTIND